MKDISVTRGKSPSFGSFLGKIRIIDWFLGIIRNKGRFGKIFVFGLEFLLYGPVVPKYRIEI